MEQTKSTVAKLRESLPSHRGITDSVKFALGTAMRGASRIMEEEKARQETVKKLESEIQQSEQTKQNLAAEERRIRQEIGDRKIANLSIPHQAAIQAQAIAAASRPKLHPGGAYAGVLGTGAS